MGGCRTSFVQTSDEQVVVGECRLVSIHAVLTGSAATTIKVHDVATSGDAAAANEVARIILKPSGDAAVSMIEFDMHSVVLRNGLYLEISDGTNEGAAVSVEFS